MRSELQPTGYGLRSSTGYPTSLDLFCEHGLTFPQISLLHLGRVQQIPGGIRQDDPADSQHIAPIGQPQGHARVLLHQQNSHAALADLTQGANLLKAGQSDPGSAGVLAGLRAWVTVNSQRGRWRSQRNPSAVSPQSVPA